MILVGRVRMLCLGLRNRCRIRTVMEEGRNGRSGSGRALGSLVFSDRDEDGELGEERRGEDENDEEGLKVIVGVCAELVIPASALELEADADPNLGVVSSTTSGAGDFDVLGPAPRLAVSSYVSASSPATDPIFDSSSCSSP